MDFKTLLGGTGQTTSDFVSWLQSWGATANNPIDAWREVLTAKGYTNISNHYSDMYREWLYSQTGFDESDNMDIEDLEHYALVNGGYTFAPVVDVFDGDLNITTVSDKVSQFGGVKGNSVTQGTASKRPAYSNGVLTFDSANLTHLAGSHISALEFGTTDYTYFVVFNSSTSPVVNMGIFGQGGTGSSDGINCQISTGTGTFTALQSDGATVVAIDSNSAVNDGNTHCAIVVRESGVLKMYIDGVLQTDTDSTVIDIGTSASQFVVGSRESGGGSLEFFLFDGDIMEIGIYSDSLKSGEIASLTSQQLSKWS